MALATPDDLHLLEEIERESDEYFKFDPPSASEHNRSLRECLSIGDMVPGIPEECYKRENYYFLRVKSSLREPHRLNACFWGFAPKVDTFKSNYWRSSPYLVLTNKVQIFMPDIDESFGRANLRNFGIGENF